MGWLIRHNWIWALLAFLLGAIIGWLLLVRRDQEVRVAGEQRARRAAEARSRTLVGAGVGPGGPGGPGAFSERMETIGVSDPGRVDPDRDPDLAPTTGAPAPGAALDPEQAPDPAGPDVQQETGAIAPGQAEVILADAATEVVPPGRYGEGSADAVPHQSPPDGFTIKGNVQSKLFHTPDSPYYGRTKPQVWFRTEADAERAGFTKYVRRPRGS
jgi:hypothetical protein